ncbi:transcriptional regulator, GntR family [Bauldia litoralis]|uniref:Transcriptional regulator, GntR family n=2 Tax=Bauldia litoralis TaxID=665467 RepID=A0A1G6A6L9_9HYPH|nr:transcriptional regulator, GntR family [Bauldia litoralis]
MQRPSLRIAASQMTDAQRELEPLTPKTLVDQAVEAIIQAAATGVFLPGDRVIEAEVARRLNVSRVPIREALRLLESQGILVNVPYRGMRLMEVDAGRLRKILEVRLALETFAAFKLQEMCKTDPATIAPLDRICADLVAAAKRGDTYGIATLDTKFHRTLCTLTGNEVLVATWEPLSSQLTIIFGLATLQIDMESIAREHSDLADLIRSGRRSALEANLRLHILDSPQSIDFDALIERRKASAGRKKR